MNILQHSYLFKDNAYSLVHPLYPSAKVYRWTGTCTCVCTSLDVLMYMCPRLPRVCAVCTEHGCVNVTCVHVDIVIDEYVFMSCGFYKSRLSTPHGILVYLMWT